jgi:hypothetical protein
MSTLFNAFEIPEQTIQSESGASYTIPENYYAIVQAQSHYGSSFKVNGVSVLYGASAVRVTENRYNNVAETRTAFTATDPCLVSVSIFKGWATTSSTADVSVFIGNIGSSIFSASGQAEKWANVHGISMNPGDYISMTKSGQSFTLAVGVSGVPLNGYESRTFRVKAGDVISGGRYHLELYRIPGTA